MKRFLIVVSIVLALLVLGGGGAVLAAEPNNQACLGKDFSGYAKGGVDFGQFIASLAKNTLTGVGNEIQAHLAGLVPDSVIPNSCNN